MEDEDVHIAARVPKHLADSLQKLALKNDRSLSAELRIAIRKHLRTEKHPTAAQVMEQEG